jgi:hypothetical protein
MVRSLDALSAFEEYNSELLPFLRKAIEDGLSAEEIRANPKIQAALEARKISLALKSDNQAVALSAIRDIQDRTQGKAIEKRELKIAMENASDEALDAKLAELLGSSDDSEESESQSETIQ